MKLICFDGSRTEINIDENKIRYMIVTVVSGDELLHVVYDDNTVEEFDSNDERLMDFFDYNYCVEKVNLDKFNKAEIDSVDADERRDKYLWTVNS